MRFAVSFALTLAVALTLQAQDPPLVAPTGALTPAEERKALVVPEGFEVQLVASEPDIQKPMQMAFDAKGRLWVPTSHHYPFAAPKGQGTDKLFILSDFGADGKARKVRTFADDLNIPIGLLPDLDHLSLFTPIPLSVLRPRYTFHNALFCVVLPLVAYALVLRSKSERA